MKELLSALLQNPDVAPKANRTKKPGLSVLFEKLGPQSSTPQLRTGVVLTFLRCMFQQTTAIVCVLVLCRILALALPLLLQYSIGHLSHMIDTAFVGHLDDPVMLSAMVLGGSFSMAAG